MDARRADRERGERSMDEQTRELMDRIASQSDEELVHMVTADAEQYREDALDYARAELRRRGVDATTAVEESDRESMDAEAPVSVDPFRGLQGASGFTEEGACLSCGGRMRDATLVAEREVSVIFSDNREERFIKAKVCSQCGHVSLIVDYENEVG
jgi:hypothetical protein